MASSTDNRQGMFTYVQELSKILFRKNPTISQKETKRRIFERLLTWKKRPTEEMEPLMPVAPLICQLYENGFVERADRLVEILERIYAFENFPVTEMLTFLATMAKIDEKQLAVVESRKFFEFSTAPSSSSVFEISLESRRKDQKIFFDRLSIPPFVRPPPLGPPDDFPNLPSICCDKSEKDEGFSSSQGSSPIPSIDDANGSMKLRESPKKKSRPETPALPVSQLNAKDFDRFWNGLMRNGPHLLISSEKSAELMSVRIASFAEFKNCYVILMSGMASWMFPRRESILVMESRIKVVGFTPLVLENLVRPSVALGNCASALHNRVKSLEPIDTRRYPTLRGFRLGLIEILRMYESDVVAHCSKASSMIELVGKCDEFLDVLRNLVLFCKFIAALIEKKTFTAKLLLDKLYAFCIDSRFSPKARSIWFTVFQFSLEPHLDLMHDWTTKTDAALASTLDEFFIKVNGRSILKDRTFWTDALLISQDRVPVIFGQRLTKKFLWLAKMSWLLLSLDIQTPLTMEDSRPQQHFSLTKPLFRRTFDSIKDDTPRNYVRGIKMEWLEKAISMKRFLKIHPVFGRKDLVDLCSALRSVFLFANGEFSSTLVAKLFEQIENRPRSIKGGGDDDPSELFDPNVFHRALDAALKSKTLDYDANRLHFNFSITDERKKSAMDYLSIIDYLQLNCDVEWPANIVLTEEAISYYRKPFVLLLKLELCTYTLTKLRRRLLKTDSKEEDGGHGVFYHRTLMQLREFDLFVRNLRTYLLHQVADVCWTKFKRATSARIKKDGGEAFNEMYAIHTRYVGEFVRRSLLNPKGKKLLYVVEKLLTYAIDFGMTALTFVTMDEEQAGGGRWRTASIGLAEKLEKTEAAHASFARTLKLFYSVLCKLSGRGYQQHLSDLLIRMNFNYYYQSEKYDSLKSSSLSRIH